MFKMNYGCIKNYVGEEKELIINAMNKGNCKNVLIGSGIAILGIIYTAVSAFQNGANSLSEAEYKALEELDLFDEKHSN